MTTASDSTGAGPRWTIGDVTITSIIEVEQHWKWEWLLPEVTPEIHEPIEWLRPDFVTDNGKFIIRIQALVVESQGKRIIVDTCVGNNKDRPTPLFDKLDTPFLAELEGAGFGRDSIDQVVCTHLHVDHVGWNTMMVDGQWVPTFPNARYLFGRTEYEYWKAEDDTERFGDVMADSISPIIDAELYDLVHSDHRLTDEVYLEPTPGHTPGHVSVRISSGGQQAVITGDMVHHPVQFAHPRLASSADVDPVASSDTREHAFSQWENDGALVIGTHFAGRGAGTLTAEHGAWRYVVG
ncbi:MAG: MBL fold metallo-hydrolase [Actinomycetia bacterium]|nr:MBL fold metallo-hydrolase [Actinomycetes bacterium]